jgi:chromosome segregation ATPase
MSASDLPSRPRRRLKPLVRRALRLYRGVNRLDRSGGGGFGLSTLVKLAGWAGLIAVLAVLAVRVRRIQDQLDPVANGVEKLRAEIETARHSVRSDSDGAREQLEHLEQDALDLRTRVEQQAELDARASRELTAAGSQARTLVARLEQDAANAEALQGDHARAQQALRTFTLSIDSGRSSLEAGNGKLAAGQQAVGDSLQKAQQRTEQLEKEVAAVGVKPARAALDKVEEDAKALADALEKTTAHAKALDAVLARNLDEVQRSTARRDEALRQAGPAVVVRPAAGVPMASPAPRPAEVDPAAAAPVSTLTH